jgi:hypothetical protein
MLGASSKAGRYAACHTTPTYFFWPVRNLTSDIGIPVPVLLLGRARNALEVSYKGEGELNSERKQQRCGSREMRCR